MRERPHEEHAGAAQVEVLDTRGLHRLIAMVLAVIVAGEIWTVLAVPALGLDDALVGRASQRLLGLNSEGGLPAAFSFLLLLSAGAALAFTARVATDESSFVRYRGRWLVMSLALTAVAFDEAFAVHEELIDYMRYNFGVSGVFSYGWIIPYGIAAGALCVLMIPPLRALPSRVRRLMLVGGVCYVSGAVGMEMVGGWLETNAAPQALYQAEVFVEELAEMIGIWVFLGAVLLVLRARSFRLEVR